MFHISETRSAQTAEKTVVINFIDTKLYAEYFQKVILKTAAKNYDIP